MKQTLHKAETRGNINHGWLNAHHSFSFGSYNDPNRMNFGTLRVLNDDILGPGMGFGTHPHENMEIVTIPLSGCVEHKDSMGYVHILKPNEVQVMSAGTGIFHSEKNCSTEEACNLLQIWIVPEKMNVQPVYSQRAFDPALRQNSLFNIIGPKGSGSALMLNQQTWFYVSTLQKGKSIDYTLKEAHNGVYLFVIEGELEANGLSLSKRDGVGFEAIESLQIVGTGESYFLLMEVRMSR